MTLETKNLFLLDDQAEPKIDWLVDNFLKLNEPAFLYGPEGSYKSLIALHLAWCISEGLPFAGMTTRQMKVLLLSLEGYSDLHTRSTAHWLEYGQPELGNVIGSPGEFTFGVDEDEKALKRFVENKDIGLLIIDHLSFATDGDLSTGKVPGIVTKQLRRMSNWPLTILVIAHSGKDISKGIKGAIEYQNNVPTVIFADKTKKRLRVTKQRSGPKGKAIAFDTKAHVINEEKQTAYCIVFEDSALDPKLTILEETINKLELEFPKGFTRQDLFNEDFKRYHGVKSRENRRKQFDRDMEKLSKTSVKTLQRQHLFVKDTKKIKDNSKVSLAKPNKTKEKQANK